MSDLNLNTMPTLNLSFIGDGVYDLLVRDHLVTCYPNAHVKELNVKKVSLVNCKSQADSIKALLPQLSEQELEVFKRGRNAHPKSASKHGTTADYHAATGLEALFGWLHLNGDRERINELFLEIISNVS